MCGISVLLRQGRPVHEAELTAMNAALRHRGPDGDGFWTRDNLGLGHTRLSIIDPALGAQPMHSVSGRSVVTFNGEIYNYRELKAELEDKGHVFTTNSDTEVLLGAYEEWGEDCVLKLRGMFAFCIADLRERKLFLARDHFGIKPLYYFAWADTFAAASELQALKCIDAFPRALNLEAIDMYLWLQYIPSPHTAFKRVHKLPPASRMSVSFNGEVSEPERYWDAMFEPDTSRTHNQWLEEVDAAVHETVSAHLVADVPFGAYLSGGVDSGTVVGHMCDELKQPVQTFSIGFHEEDFNELPFARAVASVQGTVHHEEMVEPDALGILPDLVRHYGEPFGDSSSIPTYYVSRLARQHVPMVLSGDGGDEAFGGYNTYGTWFDHPEYQSLDGWIQFMEYCDKNWRRKLWRQDMQHVMQERLPIFEQAYERVRDAELVKRVQYVDRLTYLPHAILTKVDVASMMHGLEVRTPFLDVRLWEVARKIPQSETIYKNPDGTHSGKKLLKEIFAQRYGRELAYRKKKGFGVPLELWFGPGGALEDAIHDRLLDSSSPLHEYFEPEGILGIIKNEVPGPIWLLLFFDEWLRQYVGSLHS